MAGGDPDVGETARAVPQSRRSRFVRTIRELVREIFEDDVFDAAASVAFWLLLSLPASLLAGIAALSLIDADLTAELRRITNEFVDRVFTTEADELRNAIDGVFDQTQAGLFSISLLLAVVTLTRGFAGLIRALDTAYDVDEARGFLRLRLASLGLGLGTLATVAVSTFLWAWSRSAGVPTLVRLAVALAILILWAATIFHFGPNHHTPWRYDLPGAVLAAVGWLVASVGYGWYVQVAGSGNEIVGIVGALLLGMTWFWIVCVILLVGAELNEIIADRAGVVGANTRWRTRIAAAIAERDDDADGDAAGPGERGPDDLTS